MFKLCIATLITCFCYHAGMAQTKGLSSGDSLVLKNGAILHVGDTLQLGKVSGKSNRYQYLYSPPGMFVIVPKIHLYKVYEGEDAIIQSFKEIYASKSKTKMVAVVRNKRFGSYVDIHSAIESGEIAAIRKKIAKEEDLEETLEKEER